MAGTVKHDRRERVATAANLTVSLHAGNGPLMWRAYIRWHEMGEQDMRLIVTLTAALTVLFLVLPVHP